MPDTIAPAKSNRANCRGCGRRIERAELRFGEALLNPYADGEAMCWYHLLCAACMRPEKFGPILTAQGALIADPDWFHRIVEAGLSHPRLTRLVRAERALSGSAHCRQCRAIISKGSWRLALQLFEEGRMQPIGTVHLHCAATYFGTPDVLERIRCLTPGLVAVDLAEIERGIRAGLGPDNAPL